MILEIPSQSISLNSPQSVKITIASAPKAASFIDLLK